MTAACWCPDCCDRMKARGELPDDATVVRHVKAYWEGLDLDTQLRIHLAGEEWLRVVHPERGPAVSDP